MNISRQISLRHLLLFTISIAYLTICLQLTLEQNFSRYNSYQETVESLRNNEEIVFLDKFELDSEDYLFALKDHKIAADTLVYGLHRDDEGCYLIASILNSRDKRVLLKLAVDPQTAENYSGILYKRAILTAYITEVIKLPYHKEIYNFEKQLIWEDLKYDILLVGRLNELLYVTSVIS